MALAQRKTPDDVTVPDQAVRTLLHVGCGYRNSTIPGYFRTQAWKEVRLDIDPKVEPDIISSITDMKVVESGSVDALYSSHNIEHLEFHNVFVALKEFHRVLKPEGFMLLLCPDLQVVGERLAEDKLFDTLYESPAGPIAPFDMLYGYRKYLPVNPFMAHRSGFTLKSMMQALDQVGFGTMIGVRNPDMFELNIVAYKSKTEHEKAKQQFQEVLLSRFN